MRVRQRVTRPSVALKPAPGPDSHDGVRARGRDLGLLRRDVDGHCTTRYVCP